MINVERNRKLLEEFKNKSYQELDKIENDPNISYNDYVVVCVARGLKEIEDGIPGIPAEEVFRELLGENYKKSNFAANGKKRLETY